MTSNEFTYSKECLAQLKKPKVFPVYKEHLQDVNKWHFPIKGIYESESGTIWYSQSDVDGLAHDYSHHIYYKMSRECHLEYLANKDQLIQELMDRQLRMRGW
jgi:hypothetical protein